MNLAIIMIGVGGFVLGVLCGVPIGWLLLLVGVERLGKAEGWW